MDRNRFNEDREFEELISVNSDMQISRIKKKLVYFYLKI